MSRSHSRADRLEPLKSFANGFPRVDDVVGVRREESGFTCSPPFLLPPQEGRGVLLGRAAAAVRIDADPVAGFPTEQSPDGLSQGLTQNVPKGDFNRTQRRHHQGSAAIARTAEHTLPVELDVGGVFADEVSLMFQDGLLDSGFLACEGPFAEPHDLLIRVDLDEYEVFIVSRVNDESLQVSNAEIQRPGLLAGLR